MKNSRYTTIQFTFFSNIALRLYYNTEVLFLKTKKY